MPFIDEKYLDELRAAGLHVSDPIQAFGNGVWVCKPVSTPGHTVPNFTGGYVSLGDDAPCPDLDAPMLKFFLLDGKWQVHGQDCVGKLGPDDFINEWTSPEDAVKDILDFFFGDPARMKLKADESAKANETFEAWRKSQVTSSSEQQFD